MAFAGWTAVIQDDKGNIQPGATVEVRNLNTGSLAVLYADREGTVGLGNPFQADLEGYATFYAKGAEYRITAIRGAWTTEWPYVAVGTTQGVDLADLALGLDYDAQVNTLPERDAYDGEPEGFSVLVSDVGDGRGAVYTRTDVPGEWSDPAFITGTPGPATNISIGTVDTVDYGEGSSATMTGASPEQVLNLELERGAPGRIENFQGPWSGSVTYDSGDIVESGGSLYMAMVADPAAVPPSTGWELFLPGSSVADGAVTIAKTDGTYARVTFDTVAQLVTGVVAGKTLGYDTGLIVSPGDIIEAQGFRYEVAESDATDAHVETAGGVKLYALPDSENRISTEQFNVLNVTSSPSVDASLQRAVDVAKQNGWCLFQPEWSDIILSAAEPVLARMVHLDLRGRIRRADTNPVMIVGGETGGDGLWYSRDNPTQSFGTVINTANTDAPALIVKGLRGSIMRVLRSNYVRLYADTDSSTGGTDAYIAYNEFHFLDVHVIDIDNNPDTDGDPIQWINENAFYCKRIYQIFIGRNGTYSHNHNTFYTPNVEGTGGAEIYIARGDWNKIKDCRFEGSPTIRFGATARDNKITYSWKDGGDLFRDPNRFYTRPLIIQETETGGNTGGNLVVDETRERGFASKVFEFNARTHQTFSSSASSTNGACANKLIQAFPTGGFDTVGQSSGNTIVNWTPLLPFKAGWRLLIGADADLFRARVRMYDANRVLLTDQPTYTVVPGGTWEPAGYFQTSATNNNTFGIHCQDTNVHFVSFQILGGTMGNAFSRLWAFIQPNSDFPDTFDKENAFNIEQFGDPTFLSGVTPNRGVPYVGQRLNHSNGSGFHRCSFKLSTTASGGRSAGGPSIGVQAIGGTSANDRIAIQLNDGNVLWTYVSGAPTGSEITLGEVLPANVSAGARVEIWRWETV